MMKTAEPAQDAIVITGERLERMQEPLRISRAGHVLLISLLIALLFSIAGLTVRAFDIGEYQRQIERV